MLPYHRSFHRLLITVASCAAVGLVSSPAAYAVGSTIGYVDPSTVALADRDNSNDKVGPETTSPPVYPQGPLCSVYSVPVFRTNLGVPERVEEGAGPSASGTLRGNGVFSSGSITISNNDSCSHGQVKFQLESYFCNRVGWNCNWKSIADEDWRRLPESGTLSAELTGDCRSGTDTDRMTAIVSHVELSAEDSPTGSFVPYLEIKSDDFHTDEIKLDCG